LQCMLLVQLIQKLVCGTMAVVLSAISSEMMMRPHRSHV
jgi:hypothetical protein